MSLSARRREFLAMGLRVVPDEPDDSFKPVTFACNIAPALCSDCCVRPCMRDDISDPRKDELPCD